MSKFWKKTIFWENVKRSLAVFTGPAVYGMHELGSADGWILATAAFGFIGGLISIWFTDNDHNGFVDLFE